MMRMQIAASRQQRQSQHNSIFDADHREDDEERGARATMMTIKNGDMTVIVMKTVVAGSDGSTNTKPTPLP